MVVPDSVLPGCTPKAIRHRITKIRKDGQDVMDAEQNGDAPPAAKGTKPKTTKATATGKKKGGKAVASTPPPGVDDDEQPVSGAPTPPPSARPKRGGAKRDYSKLAGEGEDADGDDGLSKKVKIEVGEDIGEGLRQTNYFDDAMESFS